MQNRGPKSKKLNFFDIFDIFFDIFVIFSLNLPDEISLYRVYTSHGSSGVKGQRGPHGDPQGRRGTPGWSIFPTPWAPGDPPQLKSKINFLTNFLRELIKTDLGIGFSIKNCIFSSRFREQIQKIWFFF